MKRYIAITFCFWMLLTTNVFAQVVEIPDPELREAIRKQLQLPAGTPITQQQMEKLYHLNAYDMGIADLTGLEYATNLEAFAAWANPISDLTPLENLTSLKGLDLGACQIVDLTPLAPLIHMESLKIGGNQIVNIAPLANLTQLTRLYLGYNQIVDIKPLANLTRLTELELSWNYQIEDISPLANLTQLKYLWLSGNRIQDISPLANLIQLDGLWITDNPIRDHSPLDGLSLTTLERDDFCQLPALPIEQRLKSRTFPSVFAAFGKPTDTQIIGLNHLSPLKQLALHDLTWRDPYFGLAYTDTPQGWKLTGPVEGAQEIRDDLLALNPNMLLLVGVRVRDAWIGYYPEDFPYWLRDENGDIVKTPSGAFLLTDFTQPGLQDIIVQHAVSAAECGLFDGIFFDWFAEAGHTVTLGYYTYEEEQLAKDNILQRIRAAVREDVLIIINTNREKLPNKAWGTNGLFMETKADNGNKYTRESIIEIEDTLRWAEENLREPQINCLEGRSVLKASPDDPNNLRWMRVFTTMSLTISDGYVLYGLEKTHQHYWYDFWNADLGRPVGAKSQAYQNIEGLFIREFTNGWAVYNRSGKEQTITLPRIATGVSSNKQDITHLLPDLDGEIYLRKGKPYDLNRDGTINILDLILVSQAFNTIDGDINGDGTTDILDLTLVAQQFMVNYRNK